LQKEVIPMMPKLSRVHLARTRATFALVAALALVALVPGPAYADNPAPPPILPAAIQVPRGNVPFLLGHATGTQNYTCQAAVAPSGDFAAVSYAWTLVAPAATLVDDKGEPITTHFAGPTWQANDGSMVVGARVAGADVSGAIPWLLLRAASTALGPGGGDQLAATTYIHRVNTTGGLAPSGGCDATALGVAVNVPYTADYYFYQPAGSA
jgi:hypothetical protein